MFTQYDVLPVKAGCLVENRESTRADDSPTVQRNSQHDENSPGCMVAASGVVQIAALPSFCPLVSGIYANLLLSNRSYRTILPSDDIFIRHMVGHCTVILLQDCATVRTVVNYFHPIHGFGATVAPGSIIVRVSRFARHVLLHHK